MIKEVFRIIIREITRHKVRTILTSVSVTVAGILICFSVFSSVNLPEILTELNTNQTPSAYQVVLSDFENDISAKEIEEIKTQTCAGSARVFLSPYITEISIRKSDGTTEYTSAVFVDGDFDIYTKKELAAAGRSVDDIPSEASVIISESCSNEENISDDGKSSVILQIMLEDGSIVEKDLIINTVLDDFVFKSMNTGSEYEMLICVDSSNDVLKNRSRVNKVVLEYSDFNSVKCAVDYLSGSEFSIEFDDQSNIDIEVESILYNTILIAISSIALVSSAICVSLTYTVSLRDRYSFYGMLKAIGYRKKHISIIGFGQIIIIAVASALASVLISSVCWYYVSSAFMKMLLMFYYTEYALKPCLNFYAVSKAFILIFVSGIVGGIVPVLEICNKKASALLVLDEQYDK